jgi:hypothetical protein
MAEETNDTPAEAPPSTPPRIVGGPSRSKAVSLTYPVEFEGRTWTEITVTRLTAGQVEAFFEDVAANGDKARLPMFDAPPEVIDALDADDFAALDEVVKDFLPRALRPA